MAAHARSTCRTFPLPFSIPADKGKRPIEDGEGSRPAKRLAVGAAGDAAGSSGAGVPEPAQADFTRLGLVQRTIKELQNVLKAWNLPVRRGWGGSGVCSELLQRLCKLCMRLPWHPARGPPVPDLAACPALPHPLQVSGKKDDLIQRILDHQRSAQQR